MTAKEYLNQAYELDRKADMILRKADFMRKSLYGRGQCSGNRISCPDGDRIGRTIVKVADYEKQADEIICRLVDIRIEIENTINTVSDPVQREILERRYLIYQPFESGYDKKTGKYIKGIAESMNYSERQIYRKHHQALKKINVSECQ